jgi:hypothetical protein
MSTVHLKNVRFNQERFRQRKLKHNIGLLWHGCANVGFKNIDIDVFFNSAIAHPNQS